jgi:hypothetical protein
MSQSFLALVNGVPRMTLSLPNIYDQSVTVVSGTPGANEIQGPVTAGTPITLPSSGSYTVVSSVTSLNVYLNGDRTERTLDWNTSGSSPYTAIVLTFDLVVGDRIDFRTERNT